jgi:hypothetical protein
MEELRRGLGAMVVMEARELQELRAGMEEVRTVLNRLSPMLHHAGAIWGRWGRIVLRAGDAYLADGRSAPLRAPSRVLAEG